MTHAMLNVRRSGAALVALGLSGALFFTSVGPASAIVTTVGLGAAGNYSVLGGQGVTNTGNTTMHMNLGSAPNPALTGFPPGLVIAPGVVDTAGAAAAQLAQTTAYDDAHGRALTATTTANLTGLTLQGGVYAGPSKAALLLPGTLTLDGAGNPNTVFIFQTDSTLITGPGSRVALINGAQECNVFWQVLSSATLGSGSTFVGNILANTSIQMQSNVTVHGRALASTASVTLINDHFTNPTCATSLPSPTTTIAPGAGTPTTTAPGTVTTAAPGVTTTTLGLTVGIVGPPRTGVAPMPANDFPWPAVLLAGVGSLGVTGVLVRRRLRAHGTPR
ncbi:MAG TPA: ice-binding family protein [Acidimicrobiia bacterium]|nr:ice-binding family protein [Acidimicrobiia bacterium]